MTTGIAETIARVKADNERATRLNWGYTFLRPDDAVALLSAAEAGIAARDAALEEAEQIARKEAALQLERVKYSRLTFAPDACEEIANAIAKRRRPA